MAAGARAKGVAYPAPNKAPAEVSCEDTFVAALQAKVVGVSDVLRSARGR